MRRLIILTVILTGISCGNQANIKSTAKTYADSTKVILQISLPFFIEKNIEDHPENIDGWESSSQIIRSVVLPLLNGTEAITPERINIVKKFAKIHPKIYVIINGLINAFVKNDGLLGLLMSKGSEAIPEYIKDHIISILTVYYMAVDEALSRENQIKSES